MPEKEGELDIEGDRCREYPVSALLLPEAIQGEQPEETLLMKAIKDIKTLENRLALEKHFPILADCIRMCRWDIVPEAII